MKTVGDKPALISVVVPVYNEAKNVTALYKQLRKLFDTDLAHYRLDLVFVDDGSSDGSLAEIMRIEKQDSEVRTIRLARNFGKEIATTAGLHHAKGDAAIMIDADLQHPVSLISRFIREWDGGADVVIGVKKPSKGAAGWFKRVTSRAFYAVMALISHTEIRANATDFRLLDRAVVTEFNRFTERNRLTRGLIDWLGFEPVYIEFRPAKRKYGKATYSTLQLIRLSVNSIVSMSYFPLKIAGWLGVLIVLVTGPVGVFIMVEKYWLGDPWGFNITGTAHLTVILLFMIGVVLICLGLIAVYIANIHDEVVSRPLYVERRRPRRR